MHYFFLALFASLTMLPGCSDDEKLCECVKAGDKVNKLSASFFDGEFSESRKDSLEKAKAYRDSICTPFQNMGPEKLHKAAKDCPSLKIETNR